MKIFRALVLFALIIVGCARTTAVVEYFEVRQGAIIDVPVDHNTFPYPITTLIINLNPPIKNHESRDFSDLFQIEAYGSESKKFKIKRIYDVNGAGKDINVEFEKKRPDIKRVRFQFNANCSGTITISSWQPS